MTNMQNEGNGGGLSQAATRMRAGKADDDDDESHTTDYPVSVKQFDSLVKVQTIWLFLCQ